MTRNTAKSYQQQIKNDLNQHSSKFKPENEYRLNNLNLKFISKIIPKEKLLFFGKFASKHKLRHKNLFLDGENTHE